MFMFIHPYVDGSHSSFTYICTVSVCGVSVVTVVLSADSCAEGITAFADITVVVVVCVVIAYANSSRPHTCS